MVRTMVDLVGANIRDIYTMIMENENDFFITILIVIFL